VSDTSNVFGRDEALHERLRQPARVAARCDAAGVDARGPEPVGADDPRVAPARRELARVLF